MRRKETVVGLDLGRHSAKAVWVERTAKALRMARCETLALPPEVSSHRDAIAPWVEKLGLSRFPCVLGISGQHVVFHPVPVLPNDPRSMEQIAAMQVLQITDMSSEGMVHGFAPFQRRPGDSRLLIALARESVVKDVLDMAREWNLLVVNVVPAPIAAFDALHDREKDPLELRLLLDVGHSSTGVVVGNAGGVVFARTFALGGQSFTDALAKSLRMPVSQAETLKLSAADLRKVSSPETDALQSAANVWMSEVLSCFSMYKNLFPSREWQPRRVVLTGGGAELGGLPEFAGARLDMPGGKATLVLDSATVQHPERFAVAAGLGLAGLSGREGGISLLPAQTADELRFRRQKPLWMAAGATAAMILAVSLVSGYRDIRRKETELGAQRVSLARRQELASQIEKTQARVAVVRSMADMVGCELRAGARMRELMDLIARVKARDDVITTIADAESYFATRIGARDVEKRPTASRGQAQDAEGTNRTARAFERVVIEGYSRKAGFTTVRDLISTMKREPFILSADLLSDELVPESASTVQSRDGRGQRFVIDVRLRTP